MSYKLLYTTGPYSWLESAVNNVFHYTGVQGV